MTEPIEFELLELATPYALHAIPDAERADIEQRVAAASTSVAAAFSEEVRAVRETTALVSATTATEPPAQLRTAVVAAIESRAGRRCHGRAAIFAAAAAIGVGLGAFGIGIAIRPSPPPSIAEQVLAAPDVRTVSGSLGGGMATVVFSDGKDARVLVMNNVPPPSPGSVYQMWLLGAQGPASAGTMDTKAVAPSTTAVLPDLGDSDALAFTVEPGTGSPRPTGTILAALPLG